jgi:hypothetical protein
VKERRPGSKPVGVDGSFNIPCSNISSMCVVITCGSMSRTSHPRGGKRLVFAFVFTRERVCACMSYRAGTRWQSRRRLQQVFNSSCQQRYSIHQ